MRRATAAARLIPARFGWSVLLQYSHLLLDRHGREVAWDFFAADPEGEWVPWPCLHSSCSCHVPCHVLTCNSRPCAGRFPGLAEARRRLVELVQGPGAALFVPSGWFHTVENLEACVSINHNW